MNLWILVTIIAAATVVVLVLALFIWLFGCHGIDKLKHPEEWKDKGNSGERTLQLTLIEDLKIPENQIFRNLYIPKPNGETSEIDILVLSKKGIFVIECKNYNGNIYGDGRRRKWIQYLGRTKSYFLNPFLQNDGHIQSLKLHLAKFGNVPIVSIVSTITCGNWKVKNLRPGDYLLGYNCHFMDIYSSMPDSEVMLRHWGAINKLILSFSGASDGIKAQHIVDIQNHHK